MKLDPREPILPGTTIGILGSGQLGRMLAIVARRMGYGVHVYSPQSNSPTAQVADREFVGAYEDDELVEAFARSVDVVTFEFENVPASTAAVCVKHALLRPDHGVLHTTQNRHREKSALAKAGFPVTPYRDVDSVEALVEAAAELGLPGVLKTAGWGYDGKGQRKLHPGDDLPAIWQTFGAEQAVLEKFIEFEREVSVVIARDTQGNTADFGVVENTHANHILDLTISPATVSEATRKAALEIARGVVAKLEFVGVLCVEFFVTDNGEVMINELAPRPHNSGHFTLDACQTSQFEQQLRAVCGLPLGSPAQSRPAAMANILGDIWPRDDQGHLIGGPDWAAALAHRDVKLHLYGKAEPHVGRKMGHLTALAETPTDAAREALAARLALSGR